MKALPTRRGRTAAAITFLSLFTLSLLGGCSVSGGVNGSVGAPDTGAHFGVNVDVGIYDGQRGTQQRYDGRTVYVVPNRRVSP